jgi:hypothetical protein
VGSCRASSSPAAACGELVLGASARPGVAEDIGDVRERPSVGYTIAKEERDERPADHGDALTFSRHRSVPADVSVGINRSSRTTMDRRTTPTLPPAPPAVPARPPRGRPPRRPQRAPSASVADRSLVSERDLGAEPRTIHHPRRPAPGGARGHARPARGDRPGDAHRQARPRRRGERFDAIRPGADLGDDFRTAAVDALLLRSGIKVEKARRPGTSAAI